MRYDIERKLPGETAFTKIKTVAAAANVFSKQDYQSSDSITSSSAGVITYRIKQVIDTSAATFDEYAIDSATVSILSPCAANKLDLIQLFPNPARASLSLKFTEQNSIAGLTIQIYNAQSQLVWKENYNKPNGTATHTIPIADLSKGSYFLLVRQNGKKYAVKEFLKQ
jgi:hypothetical protein